MIGPLFAMPPPDYYRALEINLLVVLAMAACFLRWSASSKGERVRRVRLGLLAFLGGPALGASISGLTHAFTHIHPLDVGQHYWSHIFIGTIAGFALGLVFLSSSLLCLNGPESPPRKPNP